MVFFCLLWQHQGQCRNKPGGNSAGDARRLNYSFATPLFFTLAFWRCRLSIDQYIIFLRFISHLHLFTWKWTVYFNLKSIINYLLLGTELHYHLRLVHQCSQCSLDINFTLQPECGDQVNEKPLRQNIYRLQFNVDSTVANYEHEFSNICYKDKNKSCAFKRSRGQLSIMISSKY